MQINIIKVKLFVQRVYRHLTEYDIIERLRTRKGENIQMYSASLVAKYIIRRCDELDRTISNLKLQKILYFVQAEFLVDTGKPCFGETIEAWAFGPVVPEVYREYKVYGSANIPVNNSEIVRSISQADKNRIFGIVDECSQYSASTLVEITHHQTPWIEAYKPGYNNPISNESILKYFSEEA